jgi:flagellar biosynthesis/type III secretory pathway protein FliH
MIHKNELQNFFRDFSGERGTLTRPKYSEEEMKAAQEIAYNNGFLAGKEDGILEGQKQGAENLEYQTNKVIQSLDNRLNEFFSQAQELRNICTNGVVDLIQTIILKALPQWIKNNGLIELKEEIEKLLLQLNPEAKITIHLHKLALEEMREKLKSLESKYTQLTFVDASLPGTFDFEISWPGGSAEYSLEMKAQKILDILSPKLGNITTPEPEEETYLDNTIHTNEGDTNE